MAKKVSNVEKLEAAGCLHSQHCTAAHKKAIEALSDDEVDALVRVRGKLAPHLDAKSKTTKKAEGAGQPWML